MRESHRCNNLGRKSGREQVSGMDGYHYGTGLLLIGRLTVLQSEVELRRIAIVVCYSEGSHQKLKGHVSVSRM